MSPIIALWYWLTAYVPRKIPTSASEWDFFCYVLKEAFGVEDDPAIWMTIAGNLNSQPAQKIRVPWGYIANTGKRVKISATIREYQRLYSGVLQLRLEAAIKNETDRVRKEQEVNAQQTDPEKFKEADAEPGTSSKQEHRAEQAPSVPETSQSIRIGNEHPGAGIKVTSSD